MEWVLGGVGALAIIVVLLIWMGKRNWRAYRAELDAVAQRGQRVFCWIVSAEPELYQKKKLHPVFPFAAVLFTFDRAGPEAESFLQEVATRIGDLRDSPRQSGAEKEFLHRIRPGFFGPLTPTRVPDSLTGGVEVFLVAVEVMKELLPDGHLNRPYLYAAAINGDMSSRVVMLPYPAEAE